MRKLKVAGIQALSQADTFDEKWQGKDVPHCLELLDKAVSQGANVVCLPELYPLVGQEELCTKARETGIFIVAGLADGTPAKWHNTSVIIAPDGAIVGRQTKNYPTAGEVENGVVAGTEFEVFETDIGRLGIVICADFGFFHDGMDKHKEGRADIVFNPAVWFAIADSYPMAVAGRHLEYSVPIIGVNVARPRAQVPGSTFPPAGGRSTLCVPPVVTDLEELWDWFRTKPGGIDSVDDFIHTMGTDEEILIVDIDIDAVRKFPGYFSTRKSERSQAAA